MFSACTTNSGKDRVEFIVNHNSPQISVGEIELQFTALLGMGGLRKQTVNVLYYPAEDAVCLLYRQDFMNYQQFWSRSGRQGFINALQKYNEDYEARSLERRGGRNAARKYGTVRGYLIWQQFSIAVRARANMNVELGYAFKERVPYFTVSQREAEYKDAVTRDNDRTSQNITMYFTRAQAAELAVLFEQHYLNELISRNADSVHPLETTDIDIDYYYE
ncbi:MAG: hypothetical protein FWD13_02105 [Treponema sp.]|nr:hypothetical protein [Treponema sp.]